MSRIFAIVVAIAVGIAFTAAAPQIFPALAANQTMLRVVRITVVLITLTLARLFFRSLAQPQVVEDDRPPLTSR